MGGNEMCALGLWIYLAHREAIRTKPHFPDIGPQACV